MSTQPPFIAKRLARAARWTASLGLYWLASFFGGRLRSRWLRWSCQLDGRNLLALRELAERNGPAADQAKSQLVRRAVTILRRDWSSLREHFQREPAGAAGQARLSLLDWALRCGEQDAEQLRNLGQLTGEGDDWQALARLAERVAPTEAGQTRAWIMRWAQVLDDQEALLIRQLANLDQARNPAHHEGSQVDALYTYIAAKTDAARHPRAHRAQQFAAFAQERSGDLSPSQLGQDRFVLWAVGEKHGQGFFVEFGAADGRELSNTYLLERKFNWRGIVAEPNPTYHAALRRNRRCDISDRCVWSRGDEVLQFQAVESYPPLSTLTEFRSADQHDRSQSESINVATITLNDLLRSRQAPRQIDYISIDTEGSELAILEAFDFHAYDVSVFTIEHNFTPAREKIKRLMEANGYVRVLEIFSRWDDWYVRAELAARLGQPPIAGKLAA